MQSFSAAVRTGFGVLAKLANGIRPSTDLGKRGADLSRGPNASNKLPAAAWSNTWPAPQASLDLDFANNRGFVRGVGQGGAMDAVTFTRASSGNWVDSTGTLRTGAGTFTGTANALGVNLLTFPQDFDNAAWTKSNTTYSPKTLNAADGTQTAGILTATANNGTVLQTYTASAVAYTFSVYLYRISGSGNVDITVDGVTYATQSLTTGWNRFSTTLTPAAGSKTAGVRLATNGDVVAIWGAQLEVGSSATTYYPTNINAPRFDWASTTTLPQNLLTYTESFTNAIWVLDGTATKTASTTIDPDGTQTAWRITCPAVNDAVRQSATVTTGTYVGSIYLRSRTGVNQTVRFSLAGVTAFTVTPSWQRFDTGGILLGAGSRTFIIGYSNSAVDIDVWHPQMEVGSSPTTYFAQGAYLAADTPLVANSTSNGLLIEESRTNRLLWCRDGLNGGTAVGTNLLTYSEQFQQSGSWSLIGLLAFGSGSTANATTAPDSTVTADLITEDTSSAGHGVQQLNAAAASTYTYSVYAKAASGTRYVQLRPYVSSNNWGSVVFDLATATVTQSSKGSGTNVSVPVGTITSAGSGWYRCSIVFTNAATLNNVALLMCASGTPTLNTSFGYDPYTGDGASGIYVWGAQLVQGATLTDYQITTTAAVQAWSKSNVTVAKDQTGIDGVANAATSITATAANAVLIQPISLASGSRTGSVYLKRITGTGTVQVTLDGSTYSTVDLSNGLWNRIVLSGTVTNPCVGVLIATNGDAVAMDYGQVEDGAFVTSPILTTTATATRSADVASLGATYFIPLYNATQGTLAVQATLYNRNTVTDQAFATFYTGDANNRPYVYWAANNNLISRMNGSATFIFGNGSISNNFRMAVSYGPQVQYAANNGASYLQNSADFRFQSTLRPTFLTIGYSQAGNQFNNCIRRLTYWPVQLKDIQLSDLTGPTT